MQEFKALGLRDEIATALGSFSFTSPTEIQSIAVPAILMASDAYISSATGTGKTFAYLAPVFSRIDPASDRLQALVIAPTHDLAAQLFREAERLSEASGLGIRIVQALGSIPMPRQAERLARKPHVIIGSAGRVRDLITHGQIKIDACTWAIFDEGDRLFEKEVVDLTAELLSALPDTCSRVLVSATIPERIIQKTAAWFRNPVKLFLDPAAALRDSIEHWCFHASSRDKIDFLRRFESAVKPERCLLFASSNASIFTIVKKLEHLGFPMAVLNSDREGSERRSALEAFASGEIRWLVTTDLGARGLDLLDVSHVISFDLPEEPSIYVHRAGRTGRAGKHGVSVALADLVELKRASNIAVRYGFPFVCKILDSGIVHDIEPENFFAIAEEDESARKNVKLEAARRPEGRRSSTGNAPRPRGPRPMSGQFDGRDESRRPSAPRNMAYKSTSRGTRPGDDAQHRPATPSGRPATPSGRPAASPGSREQQESRQGDQANRNRRGGQRPQQQGTSGPAPGQPQAPSPGMQSPQPASQGQQGPARQHQSSGRRRKRRGDKPGSGPADKS